MGAFDLSVKTSLPAGASNDKIHSAFSDVLLDQAAENGHRDGYSGDFQTNLGLVIHRTRKATNYRKAHALAFGDYDGLCEKRCAVHAIRVRGSRKSGAHVRWVFFAIVAE